MIFGSVCQDDQEFSTKGQGNKQSPLAEAAAATITSTATTFSEYFQILGDKIGHYVGHPELFRGQVLICRWRHKIPDEW